MFPNFFLLFPVFDPSWSLPGPPCCIHRVVPNPVCTSSCQSKVKQTSKRLKCPPEKKKKKIIPFPSFQKVFPSFFFFFFPTQPLCHELKSCLSWLFLLDHKAPGGGKLCSPEGTGTQRGDTAGGGGCGAPQNTESSRAVQEKPSARLPTSVSVELVQVRALCKANTPLELETGLGERQVSKLVHLERG